MFQRRCVVVFEGAPLTRLGLHLEFCETVLPSVRDLTHAVDLTHPVERTKYVDLAEAADFGLEVVFELFDGDLHRFVGIAVDLLTGVVTLIP